MTPLTIVIQLSHKENVIPPWTDNKRGGVSNPIAMRRGEENYTTHRCMYTTNPFLAQFQCQQDKRGGVSTHFITPLRQGEYICARDDTDHTAQAGRSDGASQPPTLSPTRPRLVVATGALAATPSARRCHLAPRWPRSPWRPSGRFPFIQNFFPHPGIPTSLLPLKLKTFISDVQGIHSPWRRH